ncbi:MAG: DUF2189 domain-containing protein [Methyloceanibacter sp.]|uniref:DUF2189 domain-containing protein n=1 Tax=Methyloceanibacter sp. TaxID=1965321 RepID=UPI001DBA4F90|nr:DUF2189 domain-containing protein [Methyloceanibacter sp.]MCB1441896.1 DUF2189 domain-containing protein [Methyloceanibacter sp.]
MADVHHIRNPVEWAWDHVTDAATSVASLGHVLMGSAKARNAPLPTVRRIGLADLRDALAKGVDDFEAYRSDVIFLFLIYPVIGLVLAWLTIGNNVLPLLFPLASGFALLGPVAAVGLYEMSRRREQSAAVNWADAFGVTRSPAFGAMLLLGIGLLGIFVLWLAAAYAIFYVTVGPEQPTSIAAFARDVFTTTPGWWMIAAGMGVGFLFAVLVLTISVVSFPLLLDRDVGLYRAVITSVRAVAKNPGTMAAWGFIVACGLAIGSLPAFIGLIIVLPILGHATWHLYRKVVV